MAKLPRSPATGMRSRTGCLTCRTRKLKCDESKPVCGHCTKAGKECRPSAGITFRHQQNASMNGSSGYISDGHLDEFFKYADTFGQKMHWLPTSVKEFRYIRDPYTDLEGLASPPVALPFYAAASPAPQDERPSTRTHSSSQRESLSSERNETVSVAASLIKMEHASPVSAHGPPHRLEDPSVRLGGQVDSGASTHFPAYRQQCVSSAAPSGSYQHVAPQSDIDPRSNQPISDDRVDNTPHITAVVQTDHEVAFLLRHFSDGVGHSMDLFDCGRFFSAYVPVLALSNPLLKNAACAYAAKQLYMVRGIKASVGGNCSHPAQMESWNNITRVDWKYYSEKYYGDAISLLVEAVKLQHDGMIRGDTHSLEGQTATQDEEASSRFSNGLLAATAILCEYEAIDAIGTVWARHLAGTKSLLDIAEVGMKPLDKVPEPEYRPRFSRARRAIFWNFARQDFAAALITESQARLDVHNLQLWRDAGLELDDAGCIVPSKGKWSEYSGGYLGIREDMVANGLIFLLSKLCNYLANGDNLHHTPPGTSAPGIDAYKSKTPRLRVPHQMLLQRWNKISHEVDSWFRNLPDTFKPCARITHPVFSETWYSIGMCGGAMANYHMARILLLSNKPHESVSRRTTIAGRLNSYASVSNEVVHHSKEICGIALARPEASVRIFLILPLVIAGHCLKNVREREVVLQLLRDIQKDLGWATEYRVQQLLTEWRRNDG